MGGSPTVAKQHVLPVGKCWDSHSYITYNRRLLVICSFIFIKYDIKYVMILSWKSVSYCGWQNDVCIIHQLFYFYDFWTDKITLYPTHRSEIWCVLCENFSKKNWSYYKWTSPCCSAPEMPTSHHHGSCGTPNRCQGINSHENNLIMTTDSVMPTALCDTDIVLESLKQTLSMSGWEVSRMLVFCYWWICLLTVIMDCDNRSATDIGCFFSLSFESILETNSHAIKGHHDNDPTASVSCLVSTSYRRVSARKM